MPTHDELVGIFGKETVELFEDVFDHPAKDNDVENNT